MAKYRIENKFFSVVRLFELCIPHNNFLLAVVDVHIEIRPPGRQNVESTTKTDTTEKLGKMLQQKLRPKHR